MKLPILFIVIFSLLIFSCKKSPERKVAPSAQNANTDLNSTDTHEEVTFKTAQSKLLFQDYLAIKAAMVNTNANKTQLAAKKMEQHFLNNTTYQRIHQIAALIAHEEKIEKQREFFVGLTEQVSGALKSDVASGKLFQQFCPMAFDGRGGYWLSDSEEVRNPYFGDLMLACGMVTEVIK